MSLNVSLPVENSTTRRVLLPEWFSADHDGMLLTSDCVNVVVTSLCVVVASWDSSTLLCFCEGVVTLQCSVHACC